MRACRTALALCLGAVGFGQEPAPAGALPPPSPPPAAAPRTITVQNLAPVARAEVAAAVVPFAEGTVPSLPDLHADGRPTVWQPFGARWPDGSLRQALCLFPVEVSALGEAAVPLVPGPGPTPTGEFLPLRARIEFVVRTKDGTVRATAPPRELLESNALRAVELRSARLGTTGLVAELLVARSRGDAHAYVDVAVFFADPTTPRLELPIEELAIETEGMALLLRHPGRLGVDQQVTERGSRVVLLRNSSLGDGQGLRRTGAMVPPLSTDGAKGQPTLADRSAQAAAVAPLLAATRWNGTGAFGPFGEPAAMPAWLQGGALRAMLAQRHLDFATGAGQGGDPFAVGPLGLAKYAGQTGDQNDFGVVKLSPIAASGLPSMLLECEPSVLQEACRPTHMFEASGVPLRAADHPEWIVWSGRTHWHCEMAKDRLGKPCPEPPFSAHDWTGRDRQHWSINHLGAFAMLTGAHWARRELANEVQLYLSGQTVDPARTTSGADSPRGGGRTELAACWMYLATGDQDLLARMRARFDQVYWPQWAGRELPEGSVRTMAIQEPDARMLGGACRYWNPWQDAIAATGFAAAWRICGNAHARTLAEELAVNVVRHGFLVDDRECIVATALRWLDGAPLTAAQQRDPQFATWSYGTGFNEWSIGAVEIARVVAEARGDTALRERCEQIQRRIRAGRQMPADGYLDRLSEWDAVRWH